MTHSHTLWGTADSIQKIDVCPSNVDLYLDDGCTISVDVGLLYAMMAAHLEQNGFWADIHFHSLPEAIKAKFDGSGLTGPGNTYPNPFNDVRGFRRGDRREVVVVKDKQRPLTEAQTRKEAGRKATAAKSVDSRKR